MSSAPAACHGARPGAPGRAPGEARTGGVVEEEDRAPLVVLVGRPNAGKSSLFNALTGGDAHVGNFPGVTVEVLEGEAALPGGRRAEVADLPGLYSIDAVVAPGTDESAASAFLERTAASGRPFVVVQVVDATQLALGLRLTRELARRPFPLVVAATQRDVLEAEGRALDTEALSRALGVPVVLLSARDGEGRARLLASAEAALSAEPRSAPEFSPDDPAARIVSESPSATERERRRRALTGKLDGFLLHPLLGPLLFLGLMASVFAAVFLVAEPVSALLEAATTWLRARAEGLLGNGLLASFVGDGLLGGAGTVLGFMPQIVILAVAIELLEASGYLARGAFLLDRLLRLLGLSGRSFVPLLMGHACAVPAIAATRIIRDPRERLTAILVLPLMTCSARIPTYALILGTFFAARSAFFKAWVFVGLYFAGILAGLVASLVLRRTATRGKSLPLVLEMPAYRVPSPGLVARQGLKTATTFLREVGTTIVVVSSILWVLLSVPAPFASADPAASPIEKSVAASVGRALEPVTEPVGFDWRINVGLIGSFGAREVMVGTMGVIFGIEDAEGRPEPLSEQLRSAKREDGSPLYTTRTGLALLAFFVLACQCMSTVAAIRRETKSLRWPAFVLAYTYALAYASAFAVYELAGLLGVP